MDAAPAGAQSGVSINLSGIPIILANRRVAYMTLTKSEVIRGAGEAVLLKTTALARKKQKGQRTMMNFNYDANSSRIMAIVFAFLAGVSAVSTAVAPAILHV